MRTGPTELSCLLSVRGLALGLRRRAAPVTNLVRDLDLDVAPGETHCIVGESGSGKSLSALAIMGLLPPGIRVTNGHIRFEGRDILSLPASERRRLLGSRMAMIFQEPMTALNPVLTIGDQIGEMFAVHRVLPRAERRAAVRSLIQEVQLSDPDRIAAAYPHQLSGGQRQRAMIAMAIALKPRLLIADEPTTALDVTTQREVLRLLKHLQSRHGMAMLFITHDLGLVAELGDRVTVMHQGSMVEQGAAAAVIRSPASAQGRLLRAAVPALQPPPPRPLSTTELLRADGLTKSFRRATGLFSTGQMLAVNHVSLHVRRGETLGIVGESGSGKSSLARMILGLLPATSGLVHFEGVRVDYGRREALARLRRGIQPVFQDPSSTLNRRRRVADIIAQGPINFGRPAADARADVPRLLTMVGLDPDCASRYPHQFSGGQRQRIAIARALALEPKMIVADEAVSALDVSVQAQILALLADLRDRLGLALLFITHDLRVAAQTCDRIMVMYQGRKVEEAPTAQLFQQPRHPYTAALLEAVPGRCLDAAHGT